MADRNKMAGKAQLPVDDGEGIVGKWSFASTLITLKIQAAGLARGYPSRPPVALPVHQTKSPRSIALTSSAFR